MFWTTVASRFKYTKQPEGYWLATDHEGRPLCRVRPLRGSTNIRLWRAYPLDAEEPRSDAPSKDGAVYWFLREGK